MPITRWTLVIAGWLVIAASAMGQGAPVTPEPELLHGHHVCLLEAEFVNHYTRVEAPPLPPDLAFRIGGASFDITYDQNVPAAARAAFDVAADLWTTYLLSTVPIKVRVRWLAFEQEGVLASAGPRLVGNFGAAPIANTWYATAQASAMQGQDLNPNNPDIEITINSQFPAWYFGTDGNPPPDHFDFVTVALHELGHGLGFVGSMRVQDGEGRWGFSPTNSQALFPIVYDRFAEADVPLPGSPLLDETIFSNPSTTLRQALTSRQVYFNAPLSISAQIESQLAQDLPVGPGGRPVLYAPSPWNPGSSYSHLTETTFYPPGSINSLMTPRLGATEVIWTPGPVTCAMFSDMGWPMGPSCLALLPDLEPPLLDEPLAVTGPCPNPTVGGGQTQVIVHVNEPQRVRATLYDILGRRVVQAFDQEVAASGPVVVGEQRRCVPGRPGSVTFNTSGLASGVYFLHIQAEEGEQTVRFTVVR